MATRKAAAAPAVAAKTAPAAKTPAAKKAPVAAKTAPAAKKTTAKAAPVVETPVATAAPIDDSAFTFYEPGTEVEFIGYSDPAFKGMFIPGQILVVTARMGTAVGDGYQVVKKEDFGVDGAPSEEAFPEELKDGPATPAEAKQAAKTEKLNTPALTKSEKKAAKNVAAANAAPLVIPEEAKPAKKGRGKKVVAAEPVEQTPTPLAVTFSDTQAVTDALAGQDALAAAKSLVLETEEAYYTLGGVLNHIYTEGLHRLAGFDGKRGFADYVEKELNIQYRKAMYLIEIYAYFRSLGVDEKKLARVGWSKAKEMVGVVTAATYDDVVDYAATHSREELKSLITTSTTTAGDGDTGTEVVKKKFTFVLFGDQAEGVERALEAASAAIEGEPKNKHSMAFEMIVAEWSMQNEGVEVTLEQMLVAVETRFGINLALVDENGVLVEDGPVEGTEQAA